MAPRRRQHKQSPPHRRHRGGRHFEESTSRILRTLRGPNRLHSNVTVTGKLSQVGREVDVQLVDPAGYDFIAFECKDHARPIDIPVVEAFATKLDDIGAKRGAIVSNSGFSEGAVRMATRLGIESLGLVDTADASIRTRIAATTLTRDLYVGGIQVRLGVGAKLPQNVDELILIGRYGREHSAAEVVKDQWNGRRIPHIRGDHQLPLVRWGFTGWRTPADHGTIPPLDLWVRISERCHVGGLAVMNSEGLYNVQTGTYETHSLTTEAWTAQKQREWVEVTSEEADLLEAIGGVSATIAMSTPALPRIQAK